MVSTIIHRTIEELEFLLGTDIPDLFGNGGNNQVFTLRLGSMLSSVPSSEFLTTNMAGTQMLSTASPEDSCSGKGLSTFEAATPLCPFHQPASIGYMGQSLAVHCIHHLQLAPECNKPGFPLRLPIPLD